jgi:hypothetical protein
LQSNIDTVESNLETDISNLDNAKVGKKSVDVAIKDSNFIADKNTIYPNCVFTASRTVTLPTTDLIEGDTEVMFNFTGLSETILANITGTIRGVTGWTIETPCTFGLLYINSTVGWEWVRGNYHATN